jgi:hypothetical protein
MSEDRAEVILVAIRQEQRHTIGGEELGHLRQHTLSHRHGAIPDVDGEQQLPDSPGFSGKISTH